MTRDVSPAFAGLDKKTPRELFGALPTPCYILDEGQLRKNGEILAKVSVHTGCKILLAQKAFSNYPLYPALAPGLAGTEASGLYEARLGAEELPGREVHVFSAAYREEEFEELLLYADHIVFNSPRQLAKFGARARTAGRSVGLRINPECSTQADHAIYDPCAPGSRLGTTREQWEQEMTESLINLLDGLHFHTLCEQDADALEITLEAVQEKFGDVLPRMKWLNMGGGHHITRPGYDLAKLEYCIQNIKNKWNLDVYLEPGEACALNAGYLAARVLDIVRNGETRIAILDASAACHMPDVIEMPYVPPLYGARPVRDARGTPCELQPSCDAKGMLCEPQVLCDVRGPQCGTQTSCDAHGGPHEPPPGMDDGAAEDSVRGRNAAENARRIYRLAGPTCLAGDVIGDYEFQEELREGDLLLFGDMAIYTTCKNNTFNGMPLPNIWKWSADGSLKRLTDFGYTDFKMRLGTFCQEPFG